MLDIHCHIVPYTDDGAVDINTSLEMARNAERLGYNGIFATSHYIIHDNEIENNSFVNNIKKLNEMFEIENINVKIYEGNEVFFTNDIVELIKEKKVCTLANLRYVLIELPLFNSIIPMNVYEEFNKLQDAGFVPILAHPERYDFVTKNFKSLVNLIESGVLLQSNIGSITGKYGKDAKKNVEKMLKNNMVHFFGTDSHNNTVYDVYDKAIKKIKKAINDEDIYEKIMYENPQRVLEDKEINVWYPKI